MSLLTGPGLNKEISIIKSVKLEGASFPTNSLWPGLST
ncbi:unannotated protein [freshwater metagenome]|uniref:Unannotated protein n=1 Tax=freshwater metagenome TaxID=449393 RepID=A0A6J6E190_9ZZZZ